MADIWQSGEDELAGRRRLHATIFCQAFSPCGKYLATGSNFGHIAVYSLSSALSPEATDEALKPFLVFTGNTGSIHSLVSTERFLICGGTEDIQAWLWSDITSKNPKVSWCFTVPSKDHFAKPETNTMSVSKDGESNYLYAGCGDNKIHLWDIDYGKYVRGLEGHKDYVHSLVTWNSGRDCVSGSEDGTARIWDTRRPGQATSIIEPYKHSTCARPHFGKWISCVAVDKAEDWMVCGGGPHLCMWHLRSLTPTTVFSTKRTHNTVMFQDDTLISAGNEAFVYHWSVNGDQRAQVPCTPTNVFHVAINDKAENTKVLSICGNSNKIDVCTNFGYKAFSLTFY